MRVVAKHSVDEWRTFAEHVTVGLLQDHLAVTPRELEARAAESPWSDYPPVNPHHLTRAVATLRRQGVIEAQTAFTRGGTFQTALTLARPSKKALRAAARKRLLAARYISWTQATKDWNPSPIGAALERVVHSSLLEAAPSGYLVLNKQGGEVRKLLGASVPGGPLDNAAWYTSLGTDGVPRDPTLVVIEAKNLREWIYPRTQELYQLLDKGLSLQVAHPQHAVVPVLVCRWAHPTTGWMAKQMGFHLITTRTQYVRPVIANIEDGERRFREVGDELAFRLELHDGRVQQMVDQFEKYLPNRIEEAAQRWQAIADHEDVPDLVAALRDEELPHDQRTAFRNTLARCVEEATLEPARWAAAEHD